MYIKRTKPLKMAEVRRDMLRHDINISVDYYPATETTSRHCSWVCTDINCDHCGNGFNTYPKFIEHLRIHHNIQFSEVKIELIMRQKYHNIER